VLRPQFYDSFNHQGRQAECRNLLELPPLLSPASRSLIDTAGRVERFTKKYADAAAKVEAAKVEAAKK